ncbi:MAG: tRNA lysidine(34) synthetase TilS, partial [Parasporobacterium sp.]|nr:tRNA lysidine(34) synthetase TilS [Parasporobacterium sp.]
MIKNTEQTLTEFLKDNKLICPGDNIVIGVSGGADSVCLLFFLSGLRNVLDFRLVAVHVNHGLRGEEADRDERYVKALCENLHVKCICVKADVRALAERKGLSVEEAGRIARYRAFGDVLSKISRASTGTGKVAVAHHRDDNVETVLLNMFRGSGIKGLRGMQPAHMVGKLPVIRPLLCISRQDILDYLNENGLTYMLDSTNSETDITRNRLRHNVIPEIQTINERAVEHVSQAASELSLAYEFLEKHIEEAFISICDIRDNGVALNTEKLKDADSFLQRAVVKRAISEAAGSEKDISRVHVK